MPRGRRAGRRYGNPRTAGESGLTAGPATCVSARPVSLSSPPSPPISSRKLHPTTSAPSARASCPAARAVPPVASTSSTISTRARCRQAVAMALERVRAVLQVVGFGHPLPGQLARLPGRDEARAEAGRHGPAQDEARAPRCPRTWVTSVLPERLGHGVDHGPEQLPVAQHRRDVLKDDPRLGIVGDRPQGVEHVAGERSDVVIGCRSSSWERAGRRPDPGARRADLRVGRAARSSCSSRSSAAVVAAGHDLHRPSARLRAYPARPRPRACRATNQRKPTPCTRPAHQEPAAVMPCAVRRRRHQHVHRDQHDRARQHVVDQRTMHVGADRALDLLAVAPDEPAQIGQDAAPETGAERGERDEPAAAPCGRCPRRNRDQVADHRQQPADERADLAVPPEERLGAVERSLRHEDVLAVAPQHRLAHEHGERVVDGAPSTLRDEQRPAAARDRRARRSSALCDAASTRQAASPARSAAAASTTRSP